jgi:hypothetical protein
MQEISLRLNCKQAAAHFWKSAAFEKESILRAHKAEDKVDALRKRASEIRAALEAVQAKQREQEKEDDLHLKLLIGSAMIVDVENASEDERMQKKVYISDVLAKNTVAQPARAFLKIKGWL